MSKFLSFLCLACAFAIGAAQNNYNPKHSGSAHHAIIHGEHWVNHHVSAPHEKHHRYPKRHKPDKSVHHAAMHTEHWLNHHVSAPHKHN
jgi:hypothetical protein